MKPIKVSELIKALKEQDQNAYVALSADSEGNSYSFVPNEMFIIPEAYIEDGLGRRDQYFEPNEISIEGDMVTDYYGNKVEKSKLKKSVVLWPSN